MTRWLLACLLALSIPFARASEDDERPRAPGETTAEDATPDEAASKAAKASDTESPRKKKKETRQDEEKRKRAQRKNLLDAVEKGEKLDAKTLAALKESGALKALDTLSHFYKSLAFHQGLRSGHDPDFVEAQASLRDRLPAGLGMNGEEVQRVLAGMDKLGRSGKLLDTQGRQVAAGAVGDESRQKGGPPEMAARQGDSPKQQGAAKREDRDDSAEKLLEALRVPRSRSPIRSRISEPPKPETPASKKPAAKGAPPKAKTRTEKIKAILSRIVDNGASPDAVRIARKTLTGMLENADPRILDNLVRKGTSVHIIPKDQNLTDLPLWASLKGVKTFDGRSWEPVRGAGGSPHPGISAVAVGEEQLTPGYRKDKDYPPRFVLIHEFAHQIQDTGLPKDNGPVSTSRVDELYGAAMNSPGKSGLGWYSDANSKEYFAETTSAYFGRGIQKGPESNSNFQRAPIGAKTLKAVQPEMYRFLRKIYGPPKNL